MMSSDDLKKTIRFNKLLGMWAAEKLGITGPDAETYSVTRRHANVQPAGAHRAADRASGARKW